jgi:hypothetical protein
MSTLRDDPGWQRSFLWAARRIRGENGAAVLSVTVAVAYLLDHLEDHPEDAYERKNNPEGIRATEATWKRVLGIARDRPTDPNPIEFNVLFNALRPDHLAILAEMEGRMTVPKAHRIDPDAEAQLDAHRLLAEFLAALTQGATDAEVLSAANQLTTHVHGLCRGRREMET